MTGMTQEQRSGSQPREGAVHSVLTVEGTQFTIYYGYYDRRDRAAERYPGENLCALYPDFLAAPRFTGDGRPFATRTQDACDRYYPRTPGQEEGWCGDCRHYPVGAPPIGACGCPFRQVEPEDPCRDGAYTQGAARPPSDPWEER